MTYLKRHGTRRVPQWAPLAGQTPNSAGGHSWAVDVWTRLRRFLILGSEGGSYYAGEWALTRENTQAVAEAVREDGRRAVAEILVVSAEGRAPKNDPALYALAVAAGAEDVETRRAALDALPRVARTGTHLFQFVRPCGGLPRLGPRTAACGRPLVRRRGRSTRSRYQAVKYRQRAGVTHRDVLRLAHPARRVGAGNPALDVSDEHARLFEWIVRGGETDGLPRVVEGFVRAQEAASAREAAALVREYRLPREALQPEHLTSPEVWEALLEDMPMTALIRNLATMTRVGVLAPGSDGTARAVAQLGDAEPHPPRAGAPDRRAGGAPHLRGRPRCTWPRRVEPGAPDRRRPGRRVLRRVRQRRAGGHAHAAGARRIGLDGVGRGRRRPGPDAARRIGGAGAGDGGDGGPSRDRGLLRRSPRLEVGHSARPLELGRRRPHAAVDLAAPAAGRRGQGGVGPAVRRHRLCAADAVRAGRSSGRSTRS